MEMNLIKQEISSRLPQGFLSILKGDNGILAGGCLRNIVSGKPVKDWDVFFVNKEDWEDFNDQMKPFEIQFTNSNLAKVNVRKFRIDDCNIDSIYYLHVQRLEYVVDTFDFTINMLWYDPNDEEIKGSLKYSADEIISHIEDKRLIVGDNLWYRASFFRALKRYDRFRNEGYKIDEENIEKYKRYIAILKPVNVKINGGN